MIRTKIHLTSENPFKFIAEYDFLYTPLLDSKVVIDKNEYTLQHMFDRIDEFGNITRYIRY